MSEEKSDFKSGKEILDYIFDPKRKTEVRDFKERDFTTGQQMVFITEDAIESPPTINGGWVIAFVTYDGFQWCCYHNGSKTWISNITQKEVFPTHWLRPVASEKTQGQITREMKDGTLFVSPIEINQSVVTEEQWIEIEQEMKNEYGLGLQHEIKEQWVFDKVKEKVNKLRRL